MKILSIDVGMKNIGVCLFKIDSKTNYKILKWDVIDLCNDELVKCGAVCYKTGKECTKSSKYYKNNNYYCKVHAKNKIYKIPPSNLSLQRLKKIKISNLQKYCDDLKLEFDVKKPKKQEYLEKITKHLDQHFFNIVYRKNINDLNVIDYGKGIKKSFEMSDYENTDIVIIENQIGPLALKMKVLQGMIMQHFIEKNCSLIEQISPSNKLKDFIGSKKTTYSERKKLSIKHTRDLIQQDNHYSDWSEHFEKHKKKDDLADSFLQGIWYIKTKNLLK